MGKGELTTRKVAKSFCAKGSSAEVDTIGGKGLTTREVAKRFRVKSGTIYRSLCVRGHYMGLRPIKLPNGSRIWSEKNCDELLADLDKKPDCDHNEEGKNG